MAEYIEREAIGKAYMDLCLAKSKLAKSRKGAAFFQSDLLPETEPTTKELFRLVMAQPAADVAPVVHGRWESVKNPQWPAYSHDKCIICGWWNTKNALCYDGNKKPGHSLHYCPNCGAKMQGGSDE